MSVTQADIVREVEAVIERAIDEGRIVVASWVTQVVVTMHQGIEGSDTDWYQVCAYENIRATVRKVTQRYKPSTEATDPQIALPGFVRLQGMQGVIIPINLLTVAEINAKIQELEAMAIGCREHAEELRRYRDEHSGTTDSAGVAA